MRVEPFEDAALAPAAFALGVCATAFHWLDEQTALAKVADALKPGGWWAMVWNAFGDPERADPFHDATDALLNDGPRGPSQAGSPADAVALNGNARRSGLGRNGSFEAIGHQARGWDLVLDPDQVVALYSTFSNMNARPAGRAARPYWRNFAASPPRRRAVLGARRPQHDHDPSGPRAGGHDGLAFGWSRTARLRAMKA